MKETITRFLDKIEEVSDVETVREDLVRTLIEEFHVPEEWFVEGESESTQVTHDTESAPLDQDLLDFTSEVKNCTRCSHIKPNPVPGYGLLDCDVLAVLDIPDVDRTHEVKTALEERGCKVFVTHLVKCPGAVDLEQLLTRPEEQYGTQCVGAWLSEEIRLVQPKVVLGLGEAFPYLVLGIRGIERVRDTVLQYDSGGRQIPTVVTYHPAYVSEYEGVNLELRRQYEKALDQVARLREKSSETIQKEIQSQSWGAS